MRFLYSFGIKLYFFAAWLLQSRNQKTKDFVKGHTRKTALELLPKTKKRIWIHISSLGEYEQVKPIIQSLKDEYEFVLTFFSPSGYNHKSVKEFTSNVFYLGPDTRNTALNNILNIEPDLFILVKYDIWLNHVFEISRKQIPIILISGLFSPDQVYFKWYGSIFKKALQQVDLLFLQNRNSKELLENHGIKNGIVCGDTRIDSVVENTKKAEEKLPDSIFDFVGNSKCFVAGSTYKTCEELIKKSIVLDKYRLIIAPHNLDKEHISSIEKLFSESCTKLSNYQSGKQVLIIDSIGLLKYLYQVAHIAYVGGGFGITVHNTLEPAAFGIPITFGPNYNKFIEATTLVKNKGAFSISNLSEFNHTLSHLSIANNYSQSCNASRSFIEENRNASNKIIGQIHSLLG